MSLVGDTVAWLLDGSHWTGTDGVPARTLEHVQVSVTAVVLAAVLALPLAFLLGHTRRGGGLVGGLSNASRAVPTFAVLVLLAATPVGFGNRATVVALVLFAIPPLLTNAYVGVRDVDPEVLEAARGMGMTGMQVLRRVELPLALPLVAAGVRTAAVQVVATATLAAYVGGGGLGRLIAEGSPDQLIAQVSGTAVSFMMSDMLSVDDTRRTVAELLGVEVRVSGRLIEATVDAPTAAVHRLTGWAVDAGYELEALSVSRVSLEDVYLSLTDTAGADTAGANQEAAE